MNKKNSLLTFVFSILLTSSLFATGIHRAGGGGAGDVSKDDNPAIFNFGVRVGTHTNGEAGVLSLSSNGTDIILTTTTDVSAGVSLTAGAAAGEGCYRY